MPNIKNKKNNINQNKKKINIKQTKKKNNTKKKQKGGSGQCSSKGPKMVKKEPANYKIFHTGQTYGSEDKDVTDWSNTMNMSTLYPGLPPKPPLDNCIIM
jgi:hypothetical protein